MKVFTKLPVLVMSCCLCSYSISGEGGVYPPLEITQRDPRDTGTNKLQFPNSNFSPYQMPMQSQLMPSADKIERENSRYSLSRYPNEFNGFSGVNEENYQMSRAANHADEINKLISNGFTRQNLDTWSPTIHETASIYAPSIQHQTTSKVTPKFNLLEPVTSKMSGKMSGLMGLIFTLLGSSSDSLLTKGFKDVLIDDIIKPLLIAKGGLKMLISKLSIPVVALVLINVEVLITVWWLWEVCPKPEPQPQPAPYQPPYPQPAPDNYNYNSTYL